MEVKEEYLSFTASRLTLFPSKKAAGHSLPQSFLLPSLLSLFPLGKNGKKSWTLPHPRELQFQRRFILPRSHILEISLFSSLLAWQRAGEMGKVLHHGKSLLMSLKANLINGIFLFLPARDTAKIHTFFFFPEYCIISNTRNFFRDMPKTTLWQ